MSTKNMFLWRNKKNISSFRFNKNALSGAMPITMFNL